MAAEASHAPAVSSAGPSRTAVLAAAVGYPWVRFAAFVMPLRVHYGGDIILIVNRTLMDAETEQLCAEQRATLEPLRTKVECGKVQCPSLVVARFLQIAELCGPYELCLATDMRDVIFQADPFVSLFRHDRAAPGRAPPPAGAAGALPPRTTDLVLSCEDKTIGASFFNAAWARKCYGPEFLKAAGRKCIVNSGTIYGTPAVFRLLTRQWAIGCPRTDDVFHGRDQVRARAHAQSHYTTDLFTRPPFAGAAPANLGLTSAPAPGPTATPARRAQIILNWLEHTGALENVSHKLQPRGRGLVNTMRYVPLEARTQRRYYTQAADWPREMPFTILSHNNRTASPVVHQYEIDAFLMAMLDDAALGWRNRTAGQPAAPLCREACGAKYPDCNGRCAQGCVQPQPEPGPRPGSATMVCRRTEPGG